jgi:BirA family biotin operon repressor/biotin-[acetyl-CoA-carboxylase] ligase
MLTIAAGVALSEAMETATGLQPVLKWPNDVYLGGGSGRKVAGILAEAGVSGGQNWVVIGFGINVLPSIFPPELALRATSLEAELGRPVDRGELFARCLIRLDARYADLRAGRVQEVIDAWRQRAASTFGRPVEWEDDGVIRRGLVNNIDVEGGLIVETDGGAATVVSGELRWL